MCCWSRQFGKIHTKIKLLQVSAGEIRCHDFGEEADCMLAFVNPSSLSEIKNEDAK